MSHSHSLKRLLENLERTNRQRRLFKKNDAILVGFSGGPDSTALLLLLCTLRRKYGLKVGAAHLNHGLSPAARRYEAFVKKFCSERSVPLYTFRLNIRKFAEAHQKSTEEAGRLARYDFFERTAKRAEFNKIATAHTLDEQAETVLMRLLRGAGLRGLAGIPYQRKQGKLDVIRPLLECRKEDILLCLRENGVRFCVDHSNRNTRFTRNRVRGNLLPRIEKDFNPQIRQSLSQLQSVCEDAQGYLDQAARRFLRAHLRKAGPKRKRLALSPLKRLHPAVFREVLLGAASELKGSLKRLGFSHVSAVTELVQSPEAPLEAHLPGLCVRKTARHLEFIDTPSE